jgi:hypothetical protein
MVPWLVSRSEQGMEKADSLDVNPSVLLTWHEKVCPSSHSMVLFLIPPSDLD